MVQFPALGLEIPEAHPDRNRYFSKSEVRFRVAKSIWKLDEYRSGRTSNHLRDAGFR
jgi:hypothetical protein